MLFSFCAVYKSFALGFSGPQFWDTSNEAFGLMCNFFTPSIPVFPCHSHKLRGKRLCAKQGILQSRSLSKTSEQWQQNPCNIAGSTAWLLYLKVIVNTITEHYNPMASRKLKNQLFGHQLNRIMNCATSCAPVSYENPTKLGTRDWRTNLMKENVRLAAFGDENMKYVLPVPWNDLITV